MTMIIIILLIVIIVSLCLLLILIARRYNYYKRALSNMAGFSIVQRMFELMAATIPATKKIEELNNMLIEVFNSKNSTISIFDGSDYEIKATNVETMYANSIKDLAIEKNFKSNVEKNISKYMVATGGKLLGYKSAAERNIRSAMFSPIYYNGIQLGFWLLEDEAENAYDSISKEELAKLKDYMGVFFEYILNQESIEGAYNTDKQTGFFNNLYLYSTVRQKTVTQPNSVLTLIQLANLPDINEKYGREVGNVLLEKAAIQIKEIFSSENIFIRYSGAKFCVVTLGSTAENMHGTVERYISTVKAAEEIVDGEKVSLAVNVVMHDIHKQSNIDREITKMAKYIDAMKDKNTIKII